MNRIKFAIRDDDVSFFTKKEQLDSAYSFMTRGGCVSLSVVPYTCPNHMNKVFPYGEGIEFGYYDIGKNKDLVNYLNDGLRNKRYDILLHGFSHEYRQISGAWKAEMIWKGEEQLSLEIMRGKHHLEDLFNCTVNVFVAPNNSIDAKSIRVIENLGMNYSGIIMYNDRDINFRYIINFCRRWGYRMIFKIPFPGVLDYGKHKELIAYTIDDYKRLIFEYKKCKERNQPFVVYTHYWWLIQNSHGKEVLEKVYNYVLDDGAEMVPLSECF